MSRRNFLKAALTTGATAAALGIVGCAKDAPASGSGASAMSASSTGAADSAGMGSMQTLDPSQAVWPVVEEISINAAGEGKVAFESEPVDPSLIVATHDVDVVVCGLGPAGDAAALACAEAGLNTVAVE